MPSLLSLRSACALAAAVGWPVDAVCDAGFRWLLINFESLPPRGRAALLDVSQGMADTLGARVGGCPLGSDKATPSA